MEDRNDKALLLDVSTLLSGETDTIEFDRSLLPDIDDPDIRLEKAVRFTGVVKECGGFVRMNATIRCTLVSSCARCLEEVEDELVLPVELDAFEQDKMPEESEEDPVCIVDSKIDLFPIASEAVTVNLPSRVLCKEDCRGLCPVCGINKNLSDCDCEKKKIDPRLEGLMDFFKK